MTGDFDISILLPTRGRPRQAETMLRSLVATAARPERIELVLYTDADDTDSLGIDARGLPCVRLVRPRAMMGVMTNDCYHASHGSHILLANDDIVFKSAGWDAALLDACDTFDDGIGMVWGNDGFTGGPTHPLLSRRVCELMGGVCPSGYDRIFIDVHLHDLFQKLKNLGHDRLRFLSAVHIEHLHVDAGKAQADSTSHKHHLLDDEMVYIHYEDHRQTIAALLLENIEAQQAVPQYPVNRDADVLLSRAA